MAEMAVVDFTQKGQNQRKPNKILKWRAVNTSCTEEVFLFIYFFTLRFCRNGALSEARVSKNSGPQSLIYPLPVQDRVPYLTARQK